MTKNNKISHTMVHLEKKQDFNKSPIWVLVLLPFNLFLPFVKISCLKALPFHLFLVKTIMKYFQFKAFLKADESRRLFQLTDNPLRQIL